MLSWVICYICINVLVYSLNFSYLNLINSTKLTSKQINMGLTFLIKKNYKNLWEKLLLKTKILTKLTTLIKILFSLWKCIAYNTWIMINTLKRHHTKFRHWILPYTQKLVQTKRWWTIRCVMNTCHGIINAFLESFK